VLGTAPAAAASYRDEVLSDAPAGYWRLGELGGSSAANEVSLGAGGTYLGGPTLGLAGALLGDANTAAGLDGVNDTVEVASTAGLGSSTRVSVEAWVLVPATPAATQTIVRKDGQYLLRLTTGGGLLFRLWTSGRRRA